VVSGLTDKQQVFVEEYLCCFNATEAARRAEYKNPNKLGPRLVKVGKIAEVIAQRIQEKAMSADEVLAHLADIARFDPGLLLGKAGVIDWDGAKEQGHTRFVKKIEWSDGSLKVETYDRMHALELLGKHQAMWIERQQIDGDSTLHIEYVNDWRESRNDA